METEKRDFIFYKIIIRGAEIMKSGLAVLMLVLLLSTNGVVASNITLPGCQSKCGSVDIPYPFGIDSNCSLPGFALSCNDIGNGVYKPFFENVEFINVSLSSGQAHIYNNISWRCYNNASNQMYGKRWGMNLNTTPYRFSETQNKFVTVGCDALASVRAAGKNKRYWNVCVSVCNNSERLSNGSCSGMGCCETSIPKGMVKYNVSFYSNFDNSDVWQFNPCSYAVLVEERSFNFRTSYVTSDEFKRTTGGRVPLVLDWAIGNETCNDARRSSTAYACVSNNSACVDSLNGLGYLCNCSSGYQGNPYVHGGCQDIDECLADPSPCIAHATYENTAGNFTCLCPSGKDGKPSEGCYRNQNQNQNTALSVKLVTGISIGLVFLLSFSFCVYIVHERRKLVKAKEAYFQKNGGWLLLDEIKSRQGLAFKIFTKEELDEATNKFDKNQILGGGGQGIVYKGILKDHRIVAVKKSKIIDERQKKEFGKEMIILSQINHVNMVKLLGCCLEVEVAMLVYEFISNGTLFQLIHNHEFPILLDVRLKIASESAQALAYLHSLASPSILHGDVKTLNILLADNNTAKVSDFGASILFPMDGNQFATLVQGIWGYLDLESIETHQLTDRSDVYSFGVVLLELLTGKKAIYSEDLKKREALHRLL